MKKVSLLPSEVAASLSPSMQREMSEIVYGRRKSRRPPAHRGQYRSTNPKLRHESTKLHYILSGGEESVYQFAGKDNEDHFASAGGMLLRDDADDGNAFDAVYDEKFVHKDTESHFKDFGMSPPRPRVRRGSSARPSRRSRAPTRRAPRRRSWARSRPRARRRRRAAARRRPATAAPRSGE